MSTTSQAIDNNMNTVVLVPAPLSQHNPSIAIQAADLPTVHGIKIWLVETAKQARAWLKLYEHPTPMAELQLFEINELQSNKQLESKFLELIREGSIGVLSDAGCPAVADPGAAVVALAHAHHICVHPLVGPNSIILALMGSGMNGQKFRFHGYLPILEKERCQAIEHTVRESSRWNETQIVIETPYRNNSLLETLVKTLNPEVMLCVASELTGAQQKIVSQPIQWWRRQAVNLDKHAAIFMWLCPPAPVTPTTNKPAGKVWQSKADYAKTQAARSKTSANRPDGGKPRSKPPGRK